MAPGRRTMSSGEALRARAARAAEDPRQMTRAATAGSRARYVRELLQENPGLTGEQLERAVQLRVRARMSELGKRSAAARRKAAAPDPRPLDAAGSAA